MGWSVGWDSNWKRDIGYGVPALCDHPDCNKEINRGLSYVCGGQPYGGEHGCGLYFCSNDLFMNRRDDIWVQLCDRCGSNQEPFNPKPDCRKWLLWKMQDESWQEWRDANPDEVLKIQGILAPEANTKRS